jgi:hypothetical protein
MRNAAQRVPTDWQGSLGPFALREGGFVIQRKQSLAVAFCMGSDLDLPKENLCVHETCMATWDPPDCTLASCGRFRHPQEHLNTCIVHRGE